MSPRYTGPRPSELCGAKHHNQCRSGAACVCWCHRGWWQCSVCRCRVDDDFTPARYGRPLVALGCGHANPDGLTWVPKAQPEGRPK